MKNDKKFNCSNGTLSASTTVGAWDDFWQSKKIRVLQNDLSDWERLVWRVGLEYWSEIFKRAPGKKILEGGAGTARLSLYMAKQGYECTMLDNSWDGLNLGQASFEKSGLKGGFVIGDVEKMGFKDNTFHIVTSGGLLEHFEDVRPVIKEMIRVLKPGGLFAAVIIPKKFSCQTIGDAQRFFAKLILRIIKFQFKGCIRESRRNFPFYENSIPLRVYKEILQEFGLESVVAIGASPFPSIALPKNLRSLYCKFMEMMMPFWKWFNHSHSKLTEIWGAAFNVYGFKK
ncbi:MAG: class I SAM-dependent methyltransferase [Spirochaetota bacterium]|nr:class I SAM-dependent methyltransferase [Thermodesulfobacteriota bacterium]MDY6970178.1 class I SAM-dependent methyltransferase [Spirochaetota bacterium]